MAFTDKSQKVARFVRRWRMEQSCAIVCEYPKDTHKAVTVFKTVAKLQPANFRLLWGCFGFWVITPAVRLRNFRNRSPSATLLKNEVSTRHRPALRNFRRGVGTIDTLWLVGWRFTSPSAQAGSAKLTGGVAFYQPLADMTRSKLSRSQTRYGCNFALVAGGVLTVAIPFAVGCQ